MNYKFLNSWDISGLEKKKAKIMIDIFRYEIFDTLDDDDFICQLLNQYTFASSDNLEEKIKIILEKFIVPHVNVSTPKVCFLKTMFGKFVVHHANERKHKICILLPFEDNMYHNSYNLAQIIRKLYRGKIDCFISFEKSTLKKYKEILLLDDFSGSGDTLLKFLNKLEKSYKKKTIYLCPLYATDDAIEKFRQFSKKKRNSYILLKDYISLLETKFITQKGVLSEEQLISFEKESKAHVNKDYIYGYKKSEILFSNYYFTPNNTYGIFWTDKIHSLFPRCDRVMEYADNTIKNAYKMLDDANCLIYKTGLSNYEKKKAVFAVMYLLGIDRTKIIKSLKIESSKYDVYMQDCITNGYITSSFEIGSNFVDIVRLKDFNFYKNFKKIISEKDVIISSLYSKEDWDID